MKPERQCTFIDGTVRDKDIPRGATHTNCSKRTDERKLFNQAIMSLQVSPVKRQVASPPKNGVIALWPNTLVVKCKYYVSQKQNWFNNKIHWYSNLLIFIVKFTERL